MTDTERPYLFTRSDDLAKWADTSADYIRYMMGQGHVPELVAAELVALHGLALELNARRLDAPKSIADSDMGVMSQGTHHEKCPCKVCVESSVIPASVDDNDLMELMTDALDDIVDANAMTVTVAEFFIGVARRVFNDPTESAGAAEIRDYIRDSTDLDIA